MTEKGKKKKQKNRSLTTDLLARTKIKKENLKKPKNQNNHPKARREATL